MTRPDPSRSFPESRTPAMLSITVNGQPRQIPDGTTVDALLRLVGRDPEVPGVAVAVADRVVRRAEWPATRLADGTHVEIVTAAQGG